MTEALETITRNLEKLHKSKILRGMPPSAAKPYMDQIGKKGFCGNYSYNTRRLVQDKQGIMSISAKGKKEVKSITDNIYDELNKYFHLKELGLSDDAYKRLSKLRTRSGSLAIDLFTKANLDLSREELYLDMCNKIIQRAKHGQDLDIEKDLIKKVFEGIEHYINRTKMYEIMRLRSPKYVPEIKDFINKALKGKFEGKGAQELSNKVKTIPEQIKKKIRITDQDKHWFQLVPKYILLVDELFGNGISKLMKNGESTIEPIKDRTEPVVLQQESVQQQSNVAIH